MLLREMEMPLRESDAEVSFRLRVEQHIAQAEAWRRDLECHLADARAHVCSGRYLEAVLSLSSADALLDTMPESEEGAWWMRRVEMVMRLVELAQRVVPDAEARIQEVISEHDAELVFED